jgi:hypothetical protein
MPYWIANIEERNGDFEYKQPIIFKAATEAEADDTREFYASTWYGKDNMRWSETDNCWWNDYVAITEGSMTEIDEHTFDQMRKHGLPDLTRKGES